MKTKTSRIIGHRVRAMSVALFIAITSAGHTAPARAQLLVIDIIAELNTYLTYFQTLLAYNQQIREWQDNVRPLTEFVESPFEETVGGLLDVVDLIDSHFGTFGGIDQYLNLFQDVPYYRLSECFNRGQRCSDGRIADLVRGDEIGIQGIKRANDRLFRGIERQQGNLRQDAARLKAMQYRVNGEQGRNAQVQAAAQLANEQANQLLQIRTLLVGQQQMQASQSQLQQNREARQRALEELLQSGRYQDRGAVVPW